MKNIISVFVSILMVLTLCSASGCQQRTADESSQTTPSKPASEESSVTKPVAVSQDDTALLDRINNALSTLAESAKPSVVNVSTTTTVSMKENPLGDMFNDPFFRRFFGDQFGPHGGPRKYKSSALGSGVIVSPDGYILTNNHVVQNVDEIKVILPDKREFTGKLVGTDPQTDVAVVKIKAEGLPAIKIGDSGKLKVGEMVIAIGNPFGLGSTVTMGIVSAVGRSHVGIADYEDFIQTDAAVNPGNSGGALINTRGELVGINTAIFSTSGGNVGIGFAIPAAMAQSVMDSIIKHGKVVRGWLGVSIQDLTPDLSKHLDIKGQKGALVADVVKDSPAEQAGIKRGDLIVEFEGEAVEDTTTLRNMVAGKQPGTSVKVTIIRSGKEKNMSVKLGELPKSAAMEMQKGSYENVMKGVYVHDLSPAIRGSLGIPQHVSGVIVTNVEDDSSASVVLKRNDVIQEINRETIKNTKDYEKAVSGIGKEDSVLLLVYRNGGFIYITVSP